MLVVVHFVYLCIFMAIQFEINIAELVKNVTERPVDPLTGQGYFDFRKAGFLSEVNQRGKMPVPLPNDRGKQFDINQVDLSEPYARDGNSMGFLCNPHGQKVPVAHDIENPRYFAKSEMERLYQELCGKAALGHKSVVAVIGTGGTICNKKSKETGQLEPGLDVAELLRFAGGDFEDKYGVASIQLPTMIDSSQGNFTIAADLAMVMSYIVNRAKQEGNTQLLEVFNGFLVPHGTDTAEHTAAYLSAMLGPDFPISWDLVCSQKTVEDIGNDVAGAIKNGLETLERLKRAGKVAQVASSSLRSVFAPGFHKFTDDGLEIFASPAFNLLAEVESPQRTDLSPYFAEGPHRRVFGQNYTRRDTFVPIIPTYGYSPIDSIRPDTNTSPELIKAKMKAMADEGRYVVKLITYGSFTASEKLLKAMIEAAQENGQIIIATNDVHGGSTQHNYAASIINTANRIAPNFTRIFATPINDASLTAKLHIADVVYGQVHLDKIIDFIRNWNYVGEIPPPPTDASEREWEAYNAIKRGPPPEFLETFVLSQ